MSYFDADLKLRALNSEDWQLYSDLQGVGLAAHNITEATRKTLGLMVSDLSAGDGVKTAAIKAYRRVYETLRKYEELGACDTEPRGVLISIIEEYARRRFETELDIYWEV